MLVGSGGSFAVVTLVTCEVYRRLSTAYVSDDVEGTNGGEGSSRVIQLDNLKVTDVDEANAYLIAKLIHGNLF